MVMVQVDSIQSNKQLSYTRVQTLIGLVFFSIIYYYLVKPARIHLNSEILYPYFLKVAENNPIKIGQFQTRINIYSENQSSPRGFGIPFGGYFWLPFFLLLIAKEKKLYYLLLGYHSILCIIPPALGYLLVNGHNWAGTLLEINELFFICFFLLSLIIGSLVIYNNWMQDIP